MKYIYLIKTELEGEEFYKIGVSKAPELRLKELQTGNALDLKLIKTYQTKFGSLLEKSLHRTFSIVNKRGEWFSLNNEQVENFIEICEKINNNLSIVYEYDKSLIKKS